MGGTTGYLEALLLACCFVQVTVAVVNLNLVRILDWRADVERMSPLVREVFSRKAYDDAIIRPGVVIGLAWTATGANPATGRGLDFRTSFCTPGPQVIRWSRENACGTACADQVTFRGTGSLRYVAGQLGIALGKRRFWIALELTIARLRGDGMLRGERGSTVMEFAYDPDGRVVQPAIGLIAWF